MEYKYLDKDGLLYVKQKIAAELDKKVDKVSGKGLSTNDFTNELKTKYDTTATKVDSIIETGGEPNIIDTVKVNGTALVPDANKAVNVTVPTQLSQLTNNGDGTTGSKYATESYVNTNGGKIDKIKVNNVEQTITDKAVNITVPTNDEIEGIVTGKGYQTSSQVESAITSKGYQTASDVSSAISTAISATYKASGSIAFESLPELSATNLGNVYNITNDFTTTTDFVEGAGKAHKAGSNVAIVKVGENYKYDVMAGFVDLSGYVASSEMVTITNAEIDKIFE